MKNMRAATIGTVITCHGGPEVWSEVLPEVWVERRNRKSTSSA